MNLRLIFTVAVLSLVNFGCGSSPHSDAPTLTFVGAAINEAGIHEYKTNPHMETQVALSKPEDRTVFVEILTNQQYQKGLEQELVAGDDWGGQRVTGRSDRSGVAQFDVGLTDIEFASSEQYWVRTGVLMGQRDFGILVSLVEIPIDKRSGNLFETITIKGQAVRVVYGVSSFIPFTVDTTDT